MNRLEDLVHEDLAAGGKHRPQPPARETGGEESQDVLAAAELFRLLRTINIHDREMAQRHGITAQQYDALLEIHFRPGPEPITIGGLAQRLHIRHNSVVATVNKLCRRGLVTRTPSQRDGRLMHLTLTDAGRALLLTYALADREWSGTAAPALR